ncbi:hypothetical protein [Yoonia sp. 208BN28-4]|uniref:hypothetical protein n=1 Tax=Yoonia sp. 208BN28-4 TaxID=3126505 RepID=UPI0030A683AF
MTAARATLVDAAAVLDYPIARDQRLPSHYFTTFWHHRWLNSTLHLTADMAVQGAALNLFFIAQSQTPIGTLPDDDLILSRLLRIDITTWQDLRDRRIGPLHNWHPVNCDGEIRLGHPVVLEVVQDALHRREHNAVSKESKAVYARQQRLKDALSALGLGKDVLADQVLIERMEQWLTDNRPGRRTIQSYEAVVVHAQQQRWFGRS